LFVRRRNEIAVKGWRRLSGRMREIDRNGDGGWEGIIGLRDWGRENEE
jgi:hypothetical protein